MISIDKYQKFKELEADITAMIAYQDNNINNHLVGLLPKSLEHTNTSSIEHPALVVILFDKSYWDRNDALDWLIDKNYITHKYHPNKNYLRFLQTNIIMGAEYTKTNLADGIILIYQKY